MEFGYSYQQDTVQNNNRLKLLQDLHQTEGLIIEHEPAIILPIPERDTKTSHVVSQEKPVPSTKAQIRYWQWQREQKLLVNNSRYMEPLTTANLSATIEIPEQGIVLPIREKAGVNSDWLSLIILLSIILFASVKHSYSKYLNHLFQSIINYSTSFRMFQEKNVSVFHGAFRLEVFFYITVSVFLFQVVNYYGIGLRYKNGLLFLMCLAAIILYFLGKKLIYRIAGSVVDGVQETGEYLFNMDNFNRIAGIFLFPVITLIAFNPFKSIDNVVVTGIILLGLIYVALLQRGIAILLKKQFSIFYLFLYLCTLEFLPLLLIYKVVV
jgi:hypothetical protein